MITESGWKRACVLDPITFHNETFMNISLRYDSVIHKSCHLPSTSSTKILHPHCKIVNWDKHRRQEAVNSEMQWYYSGVEQQEANSETNKKDGWNNGQARARFYGCLAKLSRSLPYIHRCWINWVFLEARRLGWGGGNQILSEFEQKLDLS